jgi:dihydrofolate reductase
MQCPHRRAGRRGARLADDHRLAQHPATTPDNGVYTFVGSIEEAVNVAITLAGAKDVDVFIASIGTQLLRADLVDEIRIHLMPVLLGAGHPTAR